ncbi:hypothetical protein [Pseudoalteromonas piscicida]|uniref:hypothetical protein n=1 Tax=Pseudoalteromonas piscicida TaxID=43662 RepID=UPI0030B6A3F0
MKKYLLVLLALTIFFSLIGCSEQSKPKTDKELRVALRSLNSALINTHGDDINTLPFTEGYLQLRHATLATRLDTTNVMAHKELDYLRIQERYPERYLPWPAYISVIGNVRGAVSDEALNQWLGFVQTKLIEADESNIRLNRFEHKALLEQLGTVSADFPAGQALQRYLNEYKPRSMLGLHQLPNGKEWYQSKLNFYGSIQASPTKVLASLSKLRAETQALSEVTISADTKQPYILALLPASCPKVAGLNWRDGFIDVPTSVTKCKDAVEQHKALILTLMEVDVGLHYQGWSQKQAFVALNSRLALNEQQAQQLIANIVYFPATIFAAYPHFSQP